MLDPQSANTLSDCLRIAEDIAGDYPLCLGWQSCLEPLLPPLLAPVDEQGRTYRCCIAFSVDEQLGAHFVFNEECGLMELPLTDAGFAEPLSDKARLWLRAFNEWRSGRLHLRSAPLRLV